MHNTLREKACLLCLISGDDLNKKKRDAPIAMKMAVVTQRQGTHITHAIL